MYVNQMKTNQERWLLQISCTIYIIFISKAQQPNEELKLVLWLVNVFVQEIELNLVGFWHAWITCLIFIKLLLKTFKAYSVKVILMSFNMWNTFKETLNHTCRNYEDLPGHTHCKCIMGLCWWQNLSWQFSTSWSLAQ